MKPKQLWLLSLSVVIATAFYFFLPIDCPEPARRMAFIFAVAAVLWATEAIPLYATSLLVILLEIFLLGEHAVFLKSFADPVIMLFFGGFVLAAAFQKHKIDRWIASKLVLVFGLRPYFLMFGLMIATGFLAMWLSKTATTTLMLMMVHPFLEHMNKEDPFRKALVLCIPFAANIGGTATPVGTPPNAIAMGLLGEKGIQLSFLGWVKMGFPLAVILLIFMSAVLFFVFPCNEKRLKFTYEAAEKFGRGANSVLCIGIGTVLLWLSSGWHHIPAGVVALLAVGVLAVTQLIDRKDLKSIDWDILILMWGGLALGEGMELTGLARWITLLPIFQHQGFVLLAVFCFLSVVFSTFMSNTATANLLIPIALSIPGENPVMLAVMIAIASSFDLALPISTPPMAIAYGTGEIRVKDMLKAGVIFTLVANFLLLAGFEFVMKRTLLAS